MPRRLPWKHAPVARTAKAKGKAKDDASHASPRKISNRPQDHADQEKARGEDSDVTDDEKYRITESEFVDTARYFTRDLHQQAYERLLAQQQKEIENKNTLSDLLDQPVLLSEEVSFPPPQVTESKSRPVTLSVASRDKPQVEPEKLPFQSNEAPLRVSRSINSTTRSSEVNIEALPDRPVKSIAEPEPTTTLSDAAAARRRKRQQAQKANPMTIPFF